MQTEEFWFTHSCLLCVYTSLNVSGTIFKKKQHDNWLNTVSNWFPQVFVWVWVWVCVSIQKFRQIYFHNLNFCELAFLTHSFTTVFFLEFSCALFVPYDLLAFCFQEKKKNYLIYVYFHLWMNTYRNPQCQHCKINAFYLSQMLDWFILADHWPY